MAGYECQNFKDGQVLVAHSLNKIEDALAGLCNNGPIFTATYGSTTSAELKTAYDEGNTLVLKGYIDNMDCVLSFTLYDETNNEFTFTGVDCDKIISATLKDDIWARSVAQTGDTYSFAEGTKKGAIAVTTNGETENITVHGLGEAAFLDTDSFDKSGEAKKALEDAKTYTDEKISALINGAPTTLDTLDEIAAALKDNDNIVTTLEQSIGSKANASDLTDLSNTVEGVANTALSAKSDFKDLQAEISPHLSNTSNPHKVTAEQVGAIPASGSNARPIYNDKVLALKSDIRTYSLTKDGSTIKLIGSDGEETSVTDTEGSTIFVVIRGQTSFAECVNAYNAGKLLYCDIYNNGCVFPCVWADVETHFAFAGVFPDGKTMLSVQLLKDQGWQDMVATEIPADVSVATGTLNGTIEITKNGTKTDVVVKGLGTAAYCDMGTFDTSGAASTALSNAKTYTDEKVAALVNGAPDTLNTLDELAAALKDNAGIVDTLNEAIGKKANASDLTAHTGNTSNPHGVTAAQVGALPTSGGAMTGPITYSTASGNAISSNYISAGGGYSPNTGKYGVKLICCDQVDCQTGLGQDLTALPGGYELSIAGGRNAAGDTGYISFAMHSVYSTSYDRLGYFDNGGNFYTKGQIHEGGTALSNKYAPKSLSESVETANSNALEAKSDIKDMRESLASYETKTEATNKYNEAIAYTNSGVMAANGYTDTAIANLINSAPTTLDTLGEIATAMQNNADVVTALEQSIGNKANSSDFVAHAQSKTNPHNVTASQVGALEKTTYEYNKELALGYDGKICIGKFPMYDSNISVEIKSTTDITYNGTLIIATQNINTSGGGSYTATVYGDADNMLTDSIKIHYGDGSNVFSVYINLPPWSKNLLHIQCVALKGEPTDIATAVSEIPSNATIVPTNALKAKFDGKAGATHTHAMSEISSLSDKLELIGNSALEAKSDVKDLREYFSPHLSNTSNPHNVTAEQVGALPKSGGTLSGPLVATGGDGATAGKIIFSSSGRGQITDEGTATLFGFGTVGTVYVGHGNYELLMRGNGARPTYNGRPLALLSDLTITFTISGTSYSALRGMTWGEWVNSSYNTAGATLTGDGRIQIGALVATEFGLGYQSDTDVIAAGKAYVVSA